MPSSNFQPIRLLDPCVAINSHTKWQTMQIQISWLLKKPTDLDLLCLQRQGISGLSIKNEDYFTAKSRTLFLQQKVELFSSAEISSNAQFSLFLCLVPLFTICRI